MAEPHLLDGAPREELEGLPYDALRDYHAHLGGRGSPKKVVLIDQILELRQGELNGRAAIESAIEANGVPDEDEAEPQVISPEAARKFSSATDDAIREWLVRRPDARQCLIDYARDELSRRAQEKQRRAETEALKSPGPPQYVVTKGGRIAMGGMFYQVPVGSVITEATHDFELLRSQGIEAERVRATHTEFDQLGRAVTKVDL